MLCRYVKGMVYKPSNSTKWYYKFVWKGETIKASTRQTNKRVAEQIEAAHRTRFAKGEVGIKERAEVPKLADFCKRFNEHVRIAHAAKWQTVASYTRNATILSKSKLANTRLDAITVEEIATLAARFRLNHEVSTTNRVLSTLRKMLRMAHEWGVIDRHARVKLLPGEKRRERVLATEEEELYLAVASPLLHTLATLSLSCGFRPEEMQRLKWSQVRNGYVEIWFGKTGNSRRRIELDERCIVALDKLDRSSEWVFPAPTATGHIGQDSYKDHHDKAVKESGVARFVFYSLRHTCLTNWARGGMDVYTLQKLAGHDDISTSMRYIHLSGQDTGERLREVREKLKARILGSRIAKKDTDC